MKKRVFKVFTALSVLGLAVSLSSCVDETPSSTSNKGTSAKTTTGTVASKPTTGPDENVSSSIYYCATDEGEYVLSLTGNKFTLSLLGKTYSGSYEKANDTYTFKQEGLLNCTGRLVDDVFILSVSGNSYNFYKFESYNVTFNYDGETQTTSVLGGKKLNPTVNPQKDGYTFVGWYKDSQFKEPFDFNSEVVASNLTLYGRFVENQVGFNEYTVSFYDGDQEVFESKKTVNGTVYNLPTPVSKDGKTFLGWWVSDFNDSKKLSRKYDSSVNQVLNSDTVLYAVWDDGGLHASVSDRTITWNSLGTGKKYSVEVTSPDGNVMSTSSNVLKYDYNFTTLAKGTYKVVVSCDGKSDTVYFANKTLACVSNLKVVEPGLLVFNPVENAEGYKLTVVCGNDSHEHADYDLGSNTYFDFSNCDMKEGGIEFYVTAYSKNYASSNTVSLVYDKSLGDIKNVKVVNDVLVWDRVENASSYTVVVEANGEETEYVVGNVNEFSLKEFSGSLKLSVYPESKGYNSSKAVSLNYTKNTLAAPANVDVKNMTVTWDKVEGADSYVVKFNGQEYETKYNSFNLTAEMLASGAKDYLVEVKAVASDSKNNSLYSDSFTFKYLSLSNLKYENGLLSWDSVIGASSFDIVVNDGNPINVKNSSYDLSFIKSGNNSVKVCFYDTNGNKYPWVELNVFTYALYFEPCTGDDSYELKTLYYAYGDTVELPSATNSGYVFDGWFNVPNGRKYNGVEFKNYASMPSNNVVLYANWKPQDYDLELDCGDYADNDSSKVYYKESFKLPVPMSNNSNYSFQGWFTGEAGKGTKITDASGYSLSNWGYKSEMTLYAYWVKVLNYEEVEVNGTKGYKASASEGISSITELTVPSTYNGMPVLILSSLTGATNLAKLNLPDTLQTVDTVTGLSSCYSLEAINVYETTEYNFDKVYKSYNGVLYHYDSVSSDAGYEVSYVPKQLTGDCEIMPGTVLIPVKSFYGKSISSVTIPSSVLKIGVNAFANCSKLSNVSFENTGDNSLEISEGAFSFCNNLLTVTLPARTTSFVYASSDLSKQGTFALCSQLENLNVDPNCKNYSSVNGIVTSKDGKKVLYCPEGKSGDVNLRGITTVNAQAFKNCTKITSVFVPGSVTSIGEEAFAYCYKLSKLDFELASDKIDGSNYNTLTIESKAFYNCNLSTLTLPQNARKILAYAFGSNSNLLEVNLNTIGSLEYEDGVTASTDNISSVKTLNLGVNVTEFDIASVFGGNDGNLSKINVADGNKYYSSTNDGVLFNVNKTKIIFYPALSATEYKLPEKVEEIAAGCFKNSNNLEKIIIDANIKKIGDGAFNNCVKLSEVVFENLNNELVVSDNAFSNCEVLSSITLPEKTTTLGNSAFANCSGLTTVQLPSTLSYIDSNAFNYCINLTSITLPKGLESVGDDLFNGCSKLAEINVDSENDTWLGYNGILYKKDGNAAKELYYVPAGKSGDVVIPKTVNLIAANSFANNTKIKNVSFEDGKSAVSVVNGMEVEGELTVGSGAFYSCSNLESVSLPNVTILSSNLFNYCTSLTTFEVPNTVSTIEDGVFNQCRSLSNLTFEEGNDDLELTIASVSSAWSGAVFYNSGIVDLVLPKRLTQIGDYAFNYCKSLNSINIPANIKVIGKNVFQDSALTTITFDKGSQLEKIGVRAFAGTKLTTIDLPDSVNEIGDSAFYNSSLTTFKVPKNVTVINPSTFNSCTNLTSFDFGESKVTALKASDWSYGPFAECASLESIVIPASVETIGYSTFESCYSLTSVTFEEGSHLKSIGDTAFAGTNLGSFSFPKVYDSDNKETTFESLGKNLFSYAPLASVTLSSSVNNITNVFGNCLGLEEIVVSEDNKYFKVVDDSLLVNNDCSTIYLAFSNNLKEEFTVPNTVKSIADGAFMYNQAITSLTIPASVVEIGANAFAGCSLLSSVTFDNKSKLTTAGEGAFSECESLSSVTLPDSFTEISAGMFVYCMSLSYISLKNVTSIGESAFDGCGSLKIDRLSDNLEYIGSMAFSGCESLETVTIPGSTYLSAYAFYGCSSLNNVIVKEGVSEIPSSCFDGCVSLNTISLPTSIRVLGSSAFGGTKLTEFEFEELESMGGAFYGVTTLKSIKVKSGLSMLDMNEFTGCTNLTTLELPDSVVSIGYQALSGCTSLESFNMPKNVTWIGQGAFSGSGIKEITLPKTLTKMGGYYSGSTISSWTGVSVFSGCRNLEKVTFESTNLEMIGNSCFANTPALKEINIPSSVTTISDRAFSGSGITKIDISGVTNLGSYVFSDCTNLTNVTFNDSLTKLPNYIFDGCTSLSDLIIPDTVTELGNGAFANTGITAVKLDSITTFGTNVFKGCVNLESFESSSMNLTSLPANMFSGCTKLTTVKLPDSLTKIGNGTFSGTNVSSFVVPKSLEELGDNVFKDCANLKGVNFDNNNSLLTVGASAFENCTNITALKLPESVVEIGDYAFKNSGLSGEFVLGKNVKKLGINPFTGCEGLTIKLDPQNENFYQDVDGSLYTKNNELVLCDSKLDGEFVVKDGVKVLSYAFSGCDLLTKITFNSEITEVPANLLYGANNVKEVVLPSTVTVIADNAFKDMTALETVNLPSNLEYLGSNAFQNTHLLSVTLPLSLEVINKGTFENCEYLETVTFTGENSILETIDESAFSGCSSLSSVTIPSTVKTINDNAFYKTGLLSVNVPKSVSKLGNSVFAESKLEKVVFEDGCKASGYATFDQCESLTSVTLPESLTMLDSFLFRGCTKLEGVTLPQDLTSIPIGLFKNSGLKSIVIPSKVDDLGGDAFAGCSALENVEIKANLKRIYHQAFANCTSLKSLYIPSSLLIEMDESIFLGWTSSQTIYFTKSEVAIKNVGGQALDGCNAKIVYDYKLDNKE